MKENPEAPKGNLAIPYPPPEIFKYKNRYSQHNPVEEIFHNTESSSFIFERVEYPEEGGILIYSRKTLYPFKGFVFPHALYGINIVKRFSRELIFSLVGKDLFWFYLLFAFSPRRKKIRLIERFLKFYVAANRYFLVNFILEEKKYSVFCRELRKLIDNFLTALGVDYETADSFAETVITMPEYDNAYRWRAQDLFSESGQEAILRHPAKETARLLGIYAQREPSFGEDNNTARIFINLGKAAGFFLWLPFFRKALRSAFAQADFAKLQFDEGDRYHCLLTTPYKFLGLSDEERRQRYFKLHGVENPADIEELKAKLPPRITYSFKQ